jgi:hypothetical protein
MFGVMKKCEHCKLKMVFTEEDREICFSCGREYFIENAVNKDIYDALRSLQFEKPKMGRPPKWPRAK